MTDITQTISIANQKGGVGKTTTCVNLAAALVEQGHNILLLDNDPQSNLTSYLSSGDEEEKATLDELYLLKRPISYDQAKQDFIRSHQIGLDFISSETELSGVEHYLYTKPDRELVSRNNLSWARGRYDYILIDNPPSLNLLTLNALCASNEVLIPVQTEFFSLEGIIKMQDTISVIQERWNPGLKLKGILPTQVDSRKKLTTEVLSLLEESFPTDLLKTRIRENSKLAESSGHGKTILKYAPSSNGAQDYRDLAAEMTGDL